MRLDFQGADGFQQRGLEGPVDRHDLAGRLHLRPQFPVGADEFVERPTREFQDHVVDGRFEAGFGLAGHGVLDLVEPIADGDLGRDLGDRIAGRLRGQGAGPADPGVDFDDDIVGALGVESELNVATAFDAKLADDVQRCRPQHLVFMVCQGLGRRHDDAVAGMNPHRIDIFHVADRDAVVGRIADHFILDFFPAGYAPLDQNLRNHAVGQPPVDHLVELFLAVDDAAAGAAQCVGRTDDERIADLSRKLPGRFHRFDNIAFGDRLVDFLHGLFEQFPVFRLFDRFQRRAQQFDIIFFQSTPFRHFDGEIQADLAAESCQQPVWALFGDDFFQVFRQQRLHIHPVGNVGIGHDGGGIGIDQDDFQPFLFQGPAGLRAGVVKFGCLTDDDRAGTDDHDFSEIRTFRHLSSLLSSDR